MVQKRKTEELGRKTKTGKQEAMTQKETDYSMTHNTNPKDDLIENTMPPTSAHSTAC